MTTGRGDNRKLIALISFLCAVFFTLTIVIAHSLSDELPPLSATLSLYALEEYGFILELGFYAIGLTQLLLAFLFFKRTDAKQLKFVSLFLLFAGLGVIIAATFPTLRPPASINDRLPHIIGAVMQFLFFPIAVLLLSAKMQIGNLKTYTKLTGVITVLLFITMLFLFFTPVMKDFGYFGLIEKADILIINLWLILMSFILYRTIRNKIII